MTNIDNNMKRDKMSIVELLCRANANLTDLHDIRTGKIKEGEFNSDEIVVFVLKDIRELLFRHGIAYGGVFR